MIELADRRADHLIATAPTIELELPCLAAALASVQTTKGLAVHPAKSLIAIAGAAHTARASSTILDLS